MSAGEGVPAGDKVPSMPRSPLVGAAVAPGANVPSMVEAPVGAVEGATVSWGVVGAKVKRQQQGRRGGRGINTQC